MTERLCVRDDPLLGVLVLAMAGLGGFAAWSGWMWQGAPAAMTEAMTVRGEAVALFGAGAYRYNPVFQAWAFRAQDAVLGLALLTAVWSVLFMRGVRGLAVLLAALGFCLYAYASVALSAALDWLFPIHVALFALSFFALWRAVSGAAPGFDRPGLPGAGLAGFLLLAGGGTLAVWLPPLLADLSAGRAPPRLGTATTPVTHAIDLGLIAPRSLVAALMVLRGRPAGHVIALPLLGCVLFLLPTIVLATLLQMQAGIAFSLPEWVGPIGAFLLLGLLAGWFLRYYMLVLRPVPGLGSASA
jgi:hypothetical protein